MKNTVYTENGFIDRQDYLNALADDYGLPFYEVFALASVLGENEDFDGLVTSLQDYADFIEFD